MKSAKDWLDESIAYYDVGHFHEALAACDVAIKLEPTLPFAYYCKGRILPKLNRDREALRFLEYAIQLKPDACTAPYIELADIYQRLGMKKETDACWEKVNQLKQLGRPTYWD